MGCVEDGGEKELQVQNDNFFISFSSCFALFYLFLIFR